MTVQWSVALRNARLEAWETTIGTTPYIRVYTGSAPANCAAAATGTLLWEKQLASDWSANASSGSKSIGSLPLAANCVAGGNPGHYRIYASDGTTCHEQGTVATSGSPDMTVDQTTVSLGQQMQLVSYSKTEAGS